MSDGKGACISVQARAEWGDCDPAGMAFASRFYHWMDLASHELAEKMGVPAEDMMAPTLKGFPVVAVSAEHLLPVHYRDALEVRAWISRIGRTSFGVRHEIWRIRPGEELVARGSEERVFVSREAGELRARELTPSMRAVLEKHADAVGVDSGERRST